MLRAGEAADGQRKPHDVLLREVAFFVGFCFPGLCVQHGLGACGEMILFGWNTHVASSRSGCNKYREYRRWKKKL